VSVSTKQLSGVQARTGAAILAANDEQTTHWNTTAGCAWVGLVRVQEGLSLWCLGTAAMAVARVEPGEAEVGADAGENQRRRIVTGAIRLPGKGEA
jgi:hypothetical protein